MIDSSHQFRDAIAAAGLEPPVVIEPGKIHRFPGIGKPPSNQAGWCRLFEDAQGGCFGDWSSDLSMTWQSDRGRDFTSAERAAFAEQVQATKREAESKKRAKQERASMKAAVLWNGAESAPANHPYLARKGIKPHGAKLHKGSLMLPVTEASGKLTSLQFIDANGAKRLLSSGRKQGCFIVVSGQAGVATHIVICEGWATGATIAEALPESLVLAAVDAGNLELVARVARQHWPTATVIVAGDDDRHTPGNPGVTKARVAAKVANALLALPEWPDDAPDSATDFNDLAACSGLTAVSACLRQASSPDVDLDVPNTASAATQDKWPTPLPVPTTLLPVEPFEMALLPNALRGWVADIAERMQCPPDFPAVAAMVALSSVIGRKACIAPKRYDDWRVMPNLWGVVVGRPGVMKSPALSEALKPLDRLAMHAKEAFEAEAREHAINVKLDGMSVKAAEEKAKKLVAQRKEQEARQLLLDAEEAAAEQPPVLKRYMVTDTSVEALGEILIENPWGILAYRDEIHGLLRSFDKEGQEGARAFYLQGYDGNQGYTFDRIMRGRNLHIPAVCIAMLGGIQPGKLQSYIREAVSGGAGDDGLLQRFGLLVWPDVDKGWRNVDRFPDTAAKQAAFDTFQRLGALQPTSDPETGEASPALFRFSGTAQDEFDAWRHEFESELRSGELHPALESHLSKYRKLVPALALVCALADGEDAVSQDALRRALAWSEYLRNHAERAYTAGTSVATDSARALLAKISVGKVADGFKPADVYLKSWAQLSTPKLVHEATELLCELGYLRRVERRPQGAGRPSVSFLINPATLAGG